MNKLLDTKVTDLFSRADTLELLKDAGVITLRDLINVNHRTVAVSLHRHIISS